MSTFIVKDIPSKEADKFTLNARFSYMHPAKKPQVPIVGNWSERYCCLSDSFKPLLDRIHNLEVREDDVWILTNPKCGTTWMQELAWLVSNDFDYKTAKSIDLGKRSPFIDFNGIAANIEHADTIELTNNMPSPRVIKSHLPSFLLPQQLWTKKPKIIYVFRDPKDAAVSYYHHWRGMIGYKGSKEEFIQGFMDDHIVFCPFWPHTLDFWQLRHESHIFFTSYEQMKADLRTVLRNVCKFLNKHITEQQVEEAFEHLSFDKMKTNPMTNHEKQFEALRTASKKNSEDFRFVRRGIVGSHKDELSSEIVNKLELWTKENLAPFNVGVQDFIQYSKY